MSSSCPALPPSGVGQPPTDPPAVRATQTLSCSGQPAHPTPGPADAWAGHGTARAAVPASWTEARIAALLASIPAPGPRTTDAPEDPRDVERGEDRRTHVPPRRLSRAAVLRAYAESQYALMIRQAAARDTARQLGVR